MCNYISMRDRFTDHNCSLAKALDVIGDGWSLLVLREAFFGTRRFGEFQRELGIARNILTDRLTHLVDHEVMKRVDVGRHGSRFEYHLTRRGKDLATAMTALRQWGDRWIHGIGNEPTIAVDTRTDEPVPQMRILDANNEPIPARYLQFRPGPGANPATLARYARVFAAREES